MSFVIASWFEFKSGSIGKKLKPESVLLQVQHYDLDSLDNLQVLATKDGKLLAYHTFHGNIDCAI